MSEGTDNAVTETTPDSTQEGPLELEGFSEALEVGMPPDPDVASQPEPTEAVDESVVEETPQSEETAPAEAEATETPEETEDPEPTPEVNFDGFSDDLKTLWERLHKEGHVTAEEIEAQRVDTMFHSAFTKKTMALAEQRKEFERTAEERQEDLAMLDKIRGDDRLHDAWLRMQQGDIESPAGDGESDEDLVDRRTVREVARQEYKDARAAEAARDQEVQSARDTKEAALVEALQESMKILGVDAVQMDKYIDAEVATLPPGTDAILHFSPEEAQRLVTSRHALAMAQAKNAELNALLEQKTARDARTAKQSVQPARRVAGDGSMTILQQTEADLGIDPDWGNVQGFGHRGAHD